MRDRRDASPCVYSSSYTFYFLKKRSTGGLEILRVFSTFDEIFRDIFYFIFSGRILSILLGADNMFQLRVERSLLEIGYASHRSITRGTFFLFLENPRRSWNFLCYLTGRIYFFFSVGGIALPLVTSVDPLRKSSPSC
jgi:hypothetical protein